MANLFNRNKTFRPLKAHAHKGEKMSQYAKRTLATLGSGSMRQAVQLPPGEDVNEWIAVNTVDFFNEINLLYGTVSEFCTEQSCPVMAAGDVTYRWADGVKVKNPIECSAPQYVDYLMQWVESQLNDESMFPVRPDTPFPKKFVKLVSPIYKRFFRVYAHIYHSHFQRIVDVGAEAHLNTCFKHFFYFIDEFDLVEDKEQAPLKDLIGKLMSEKKERKEGDRKENKNGGGDD
jgi:MOB kinase activator 1